MNHRPVLPFALLITLLIASLATAQTQESPAVAEGAALSLSPSQDLIRQHMAFLASDEMEGREAGTPGYDKAADYVAEQFKKLGLDAGGDDETYFQEVTFRRSYRNADKVSLEARVADDSVLALEVGSDYHVSGSLLNEESDVSAEVVFVGFGLVAPERDRDDYAGLDVEGKLVAMLSATPEGIQSEERAFYGSRKAVEASERGAVGIVSLYTPTAEKIFAFERIAKQGVLNSARMGWVKPDGELFSKAPNLQVAATFSMDGAAKLFADAPRPWAEILEAVATEGAEIPTFDLPISMRITQASKMDSPRSANVLGVIEGSDPELKNEVLVLSAHLDHLGIAKTDAEDRINNGALDNAAGVATLLETARMIMGMQRPRRTIVFLANTAEEKGLLGAEYFVKNQTLGGKKIVANINLDMPVLTYDFEDVVVFGGDRSSLRGSIQAAAHQMGLLMGEDPFPEQGVFTRSDHFRFVEAGIPSVMLATGIANGGEQAWATHFAEHYHQPSDDMDNDIDFAAAAKFAELKTRITLQVANDQQKPLWNKGDFFGRQFNGPMATD